MAPAFPPLQISKVFVAGGLPTVTYNPRDALGLEQRLREYLDERHKILSLSGPTKCGKTVLLKSVLGNANVELISLSGGDVASVDAFWLAVADHLGIHGTEGQTTGQEEGNTLGGTGGVNAGFFGVGVKAEGSATQAFKESRATTSTRTRSIVQATKQALRARLPVVVIDDFHYIDPEVQRLIVRGVKDQVFDGVGFIIASVPHRAFDAVRVEKEMTGRVEQLPISFWSVDELLGIASDGFDALNLLDGGGLATRLARESFQSPHLMQEFCLRLCRENGVERTEAEPKGLQPPDWDSFFRKSASSASKSAFDLLARGPRQRADRKERRLKDGRIVDIYGAVLAAIAETGPLTTLTYEELRASLREIMAEDQPQRHEVTRVLEEMSKIARDQIEGEPVVDYDAEYGILHISDPFFAYYLRWGVRPTVSRK